MRFERQHFVFQLQLVRPPDGGGFAILLLSSFFFRQLLSGHMIGNECDLKCMSEIWGIHSP